MLLTIYRNHPKKTLLFLILLFGGITYKFRSHLFIAFLQKMQSKLTKDMELQMEKGQRINQKLDLIQQTVDEFYENKEFLNIIFELLKLDQIYEIGNQLKQNKDINQEQKAVLYQKMAELFIIFEVSTLLFLRKSECLILLSKILILTITIPDEQMFIGNLLDQIQQIILTQQYHQVVTIIQEQFRNQPQLYKYDKQVNLKDIIKNLVSDCQREFMDYTFQQKVEDQCQEVLNQNIIQLQQYYQGQNINIIRDQSKYLVEHLFKINKSLGLVTFSDYSISYSFQKLDNRLQLFPYINDINNQILIKQLVKHHQVIKEEFYAKENIQNTHNYYQKVLKQSLRIKDEKSAEDNKISDNNLIIIQKVLHEFKIFEILKQSQNQIIRKLVFGNELDDTATSQKKMIRVISIKNLIIHIFNYNINCLCKDILYSTYLRIDNIFCLLETYDQKWRISQQIANIEKLGLYYYFIYLLKFRAKITEIILSLKINNLLNKMQIQNAAIIKQIISSLFAAVASMLMKIVSELDFNQTLYLRGLIGLIILASVAIHQNIQVYNFDKHTMKSLINRGVIAGFGAFIYFKGLNLVLVSESILLNRMSPIWTSIIYIIVLKKEQFSIRLLINMTLSGFGIFLIARNKTNNNQEKITEDSSSHWIGILLILIASVTQAIVNILVKSVNKQVDSIVITLYQSFFAINLPIINSLYDATNFNVPSINETFLIIIASVISLFAGILQIQSFREGKLTVVSNVSQIQLFFGYLIDFFIFSAKFNYQQIIGNILLLCSLIPLIWK